MLQKSTTFGGEIKRYCDAKQKRINGVREWVYILKMEYIRNDNDEE
jgi:hypothetical protein